MAITLSAGARLGPYELLAPMGEGRHERSVSGADTGLTGRVAADSDNGLVYT